MASDPQQFGGPLPSPAGAEVLPGAAVEARPPAAGNRYQVRQDDGGRHLVCVEAPEVKVRLDRDLTVTANAARKAPEGTIYLDGAAQGAPFLDFERNVFNLDHHEGCERRFTMATCEQALVLVLRGMDLRERPWTLYANAPDLDTVLALWVLLNAMHLGPENPEIRKAVVPLVRLEGIIDAQGLELLELSGFSDERLTEKTAQLDELRALELSARAEAGEADLLEVTATLLHAIDEMVYPEDHLQPLPEIEELAREELGNRRVVLVVKAGSGIYEVEPALKRLYGKRLGVIALQKDERTYTLRQVDSFLPVNLEAAYAKLNLLEPAAGGTADRWGGSGEIGGSPRSSGTELTPAEIAAICRLAFRRQPLAARLRAAGRALWTSGVAVAAGWLAAGLALGLAPWRWYDWLGSPIPFALGCLAAAVALVALGSGRRRRRIYGLQLPAGLDWLWTAPLAVAGALAGGAWGPPAEGGLTAGLLAGWLLLPLAAEAVFRGMVYGSLVLSFEIQTYHGRWFLSRPMVISALLYLLWTLPIGHPSPAVEAFGGALPGLGVAGALALGLALGASRERTGSLVAPCLLHWLAAAVALLVS